MKVSILIPHFTTGKMTAYAISQLLKYKGKHELDIHVVDNKTSDGSAAIYLKPFSNDITVYGYPSDLLQSHGIAFDFVMGFVKTSHFITIESDSYPTEYGWLDYYERLINDGYDCAGSLLKLSGGSYIHPCGAMYSRKTWEECHEYVNSLQYDYFPNMSRKLGFDSHLMVHSSIKDEFLKTPEDYIDLAEGYKPYTKELAIKKLDHYMPVGRGVFHNGVGGREESVKTYGDRTMDSETPFAILGKNTRKLVNRIGLEPGQFFSYWMNAMNKKIFYIPTDTKWIEGKENQQQEYTINEAGWHHCWGISAYKDVDPNDEIAKIKQRIPEELYETMPDRYKIK